jgi:hypothetical protein
MVSRTCDLPAKAHHSYHAQRIEGVAGGKGTSVGEYANVEVGQNQRKQSFQCGMGLLNWGDGEERGYRQAVKVRE